MRQLALSLVIAAAAWADGAARGQELLPGPAAPGQAPNPFAPLPEGTVIGPAGPVAPGPPAPVKSSAVIPPLDAE
ncbi:MAG: hypothetical protein ACKOC4_01460, partial [Planctomycetia bacterium]